MEIFLLILYDSLLRIDESLDQLSGAKWCLCLIQVIGRLKFKLLFRAGDHVTFVYSNIVSRLMVHFVYLLFFCDIYLSKPSINLDTSCYRKPNCYSNGIKISDIAFVFFYTYTCSKR